MKAKMDNDHTKDMAYRRLQKVTLENLQESFALKKIWDDRQGKLGMSQKQFGERFGVGNQSMVSKLILGVQPISLKAAIGFARGLGCEISDFSPRLAAAKKAAEEGMPAATLARIYTFRERARGDHKRPLVPVFGPDGGHMLEELCDPHEVLSYVDIKLGCEVYSNDDRAFAARIESWHEAWPRYTRGEVVVVSPAKELEVGCDCFVTHPGPEWREFTLARLLSVTSPSKLVFDRWDGKHVEIDDMRGAFRITHRLQADSIVRIGSTEQNSSK